MPIWYFTQLLKLQFGVQNGECYPSIILPIRVVPYLCALKVGPISY